MTTMKTWMTLLICVMTLARVTPAQCAIGMDGFEWATCCMQVQPGILNLPTPPTLTIDGRWACLLDCDLEQDYTVNTTVSFNWSPYCDYALINLTATPTSAGAPFLGGFAYAKYSRTWTETDSAGITSQVWRFLINGDWQVSGTAPCPAPPSASIMPVHMHGFIDYICDPSLGWTCRLNINHLKGCWSHAWWSTRPLTGALAGNQRSYHLVAPSNFVFTPHAAPSGPIVGESIRANVLTWSPFNYECRGEARVASGTLGNVGSPECNSCTTVPAGASTPYQHQNLTGTSFCGSTPTPFSSMPFGALLPGGLLSMALGHWMTADGPLEVTTYFGLMNYTAPCTGEGPMHIVAGAATTLPLGVFANTFAPVGGTPLTMSTVLDLGNARLFPPFTTAPWGSPYATSILWQLGL